MISWKHENPPSWHSETAADMRHDLTSAAKPGCASIKDQGFTLLWPNPQHRPAIRINTQWYLRWSWIRVGDQRERRILVRTIHGAISTRKTMSCPRGFACLLWKNKSRGCRGVNSRGLCADRQKPPAFTAVPAPSNYSNCALYTLFMGQ